jgi:hypothetical protein
LKDFLDLEIDILCLRKLSNAKLCNLRSAEIVVIENTGNLKNACKIMFGKPEGERHIAMRRRRREDNIKTDIIEMGVAMWTG